MANGYDASFKIPVTAVIIHGEEIKCKNITFEPVEFMLKTVNYPTLATKEDGTTIALSPKLSEPSDEIIYVFDLDGKKHHLKDFAKLITTQMAEKIYLDDPIQELHQNILISYPAVAAVITKYGYIPKQYISPEHKKLEVCLEKIITKDIHKRIKDILQTKAGGPRFIKNLAEIQQDIIVLIEKDNVIPAELLSPSDLSEKIATFNTEHTQNPTPSLS